MALSAVRVGSEQVDFAHVTPLVEVLLTGAGHVPASSRLIGTAVGRHLRYRSHRTPAVADGAGHPARLEIDLESPAHDLAVTLVLEIYADVAAVRSTVTVTNAGTDAIAVEQITSWASSVGGPVTEGDPTGDWVLVSGHNDWLGESRWDQRALRALFPRIEERLTGHPPRGSHQVVSRGTWSTGAALPVALIESTRAGLAWMWQIEHNGPWRWDVGQDTTGCWFALSGPTDVDAGWSVVLEPGRSFTSVPVSVALGHDLAAAVQMMTEHRRRSRRGHVDNEAMAVVFNDYMNTLNGDPTTAKLMPLIDAAAAAGAEVFCIDAGWYDDSGHWWDTVGAWEPSATRFPGGLGEVVDRIREHGMVPGLWLEPEVVGVRSPVADTLPAAAFFSRHGVRVVEHERYLLDLRHPAARGHLDEVVDRLVSDFGAGFFKLDYNVDPRTGPDRDAVSPGDALLSHNRAHLAWIDGVLDRHPDLVLENCSSGAMRSDPAMLSRLAMQSTSDQQDFRLYPPIAASAPMVMPPEQAASWAYPQPGMSAEEAAFCLVTGLLGRFYVSGFLNEMSQPLRRLVAEAIRAAKDLRGSIQRSHPIWPCGLPTWDAPWVSLGLVGDDETLLSVWRRGGPDHVVLELPHLRGRDIEVTPIFPLELPAWSTAWLSHTGTLRVGGVPEGVSARTLRVRPVAPGHGSSHVGSTAEPAPHHEGVSP